MERSSRPIAFSRKILSSVALSLLFVCAPQASHAESSHGAVAKLQKGILETKAVPFTSNGVWSPYSILQAFHMVQLGADGETRKEMQTLLDETNPGFLLLGKQEEEAKLSVANRVYLSDKFGKKKGGLAGLFAKIRGKSQKTDNDVVNEYMDRVQKAVKSDARSTNFDESDKVIKEINTFISDETRGKIKDLIKGGDINSMTRLVVVNALYFKGLWKTAFSKIKDTFYAITEEGTLSKEVNMDFLKRKIKENEPKLYLNIEEVEAVGIPYKDSKLCLFIYMPKNNPNLGVEETSALRAFEKKMSTEPTFTDSLVNEMRRHRHKSAVLDLSIPKFKLSGSANHLDMRPIFEAIGQKTLFDENTSDLSRITGATDLFVSKFMHAAEIEVDEFGTEAAAASVAVMAYKMRPAEPEQIVLKINRPFVFQLRWNKNNALSGSEEEDVVLFEGRVVDPSK